MDDTLLYCIAALVGVQLGVLTTISRSIGRLEVLLPYLERRIATLERKTNVNVTYSRNAGPHEQPCP